MWHLRPHQPAWGSPSFTTAELAYLNAVTQVFIKPFLLLNFNNLGYR